MKETTPAAMPPCFDRWCQRFDNIFGNIAQKREFRNYLGGLLGESERKNIQQMAANAVGVTYHKLHHFLTAAPWSALELNQRRLEVMNQCRQTKINQGFSLIIDDSGHRKSVEVQGGSFRWLEHDRVGDMEKTVPELIAAISPSDWALVPQSILELIYELVRRTDKLEEEMAQLRTENELLKE